MPDVDRADGVAENLSATVNTVLDRLVTDAASASELLRTASSEAAANLHSIEERTNNFNQTLGTRSARTCADTASAVTSA